MKAIDQTLVCKGKGTCMQAVLASLFETDLDKTINIMDFLESNWYIPFMRWLESSTKYEYCGVVNAHDEKELTLDALQSMYAVNGFFFGVVPSKNFEGVTHAVILDRLGCVVHDPDPSKKWLGINTVETRELIYWYDFQPRNGFIYER